MNMECLSSSYSFPSFSHLLTFIGFSTKLIHSEINTKLFLLSCTFSDVCDHKTVLTCMCPLVCLVEGGSVQMICSHWTFLIVCYQPTLFLTSSFPLSPSSTISHNLPFYTLSHYTLPFYTLSPFPSSSRTISSYITPNLLISEKETTDYSHDIYIHLVILYSWSQ